MSVPPPPPPSYPPPPPPPSGGFGGWPAPAPSVPPGEVALRLDLPERMPRWRPFFGWVLAIPHIVVLYALNLVAQVCSFIAFFAILFTKRVPDGLYGALQMVMRYQVRVGTYVLALRTDYPPFEFPTIAEDPGSDQPLLTYGGQPALRRFGPLYKWFLAIPLFFVAIAVYVVALVQWLVLAFTVLFTGKVPAGPHRFLVNAIRWGVSLNMYLLMTDRYPAWWPADR